jgi:hypothetical protein
MASSGRTNRGDPCWRPPRPAASAREAHAGRLRPRVRRPYSRRSSWPSSQGNPLGAPPLHRRRSERRRISYDARDTVEPRTEAPMEELPPPAIPCAILSIRQSTVSFISPQRTYLRMSLPCPHGRAQADDGSERGTRSRAATRQEIEMRERGDKEGAFWSGDWKYTACEWVSWQSCGH